MYVAIGRRIRDARLRAGWTQGDLAACIGQTRLSMIGFEKAKQRVQIHTLKQIAALLGVTLSDLLPPER